MAEPMNLTQTLALKLSLAQAPFFEAPPPRLQPEPSTISRLAADALSRLSNPALRYGEPGSPGWHHLRHLDGLRGAREGDAEARRQVDRQIGRR
jgi:hypothetical protein